MIGLGMLLGQVAAPEMASGQGCMPVRFTSPALGGQQASFLQPHEWQLGVSVRRVATNRFFVGTQEDETKAPFGQPLNLRLNSVDLSLAYATSERFSLALTVPLAYSTIENTQPDLLRHQVSTGGVGDINLMGNLWLGAPTRHLNGNVLLGLGVKAPTGSNHVTGAFHDAQGNVSQVPVTQAVQLGDGGWAVLLQGQAFRQLFPRSALYFSGSYSVSLREHTDVLRSPGVLYAVPDVYSARLGLAYGLMAEPGLSVSLGGRIDGTPVRNLVTGKSDFFRSAGYTLYVDPGLSLQRGPSQFTLSVPVRVHHNYLSMQLSTGQTRPGMGGVSDYVIYAGYSRRF
jgi:hypothetical protein